MDQLSVFARDRATWAEISILRLWNLPSLFAYPKLGKCLSQLRHMAALFKFNIWPLTWIHHFGHVMIELCLVNNLGDRNFLLTTLS